MPAFRPRIAPDVADRALTLLFLITIDPHLRQFFLAAGYTTADHAQGYDLAHNAVDAAMEAKGGVSVGWRAAGRQLELWIDDEGVGLPNASNLFVPFFTTKPGGSGIGLVLCRQIAEAHGGTLTLENRTDGRRGCRAFLRLPL